MSFIKKHIQTQSKRRVSNISQGKFSFSFPFYSSLGCVRLLFLFFTCQYLFLNKCFVIIIHPIMILVVVIDFLFYNDIIIYYFRSTLFILLRRKKRHMQPIFNTRRVK